jgi:spermidine synthase
MTPFDDPTLPHTMIRIHEHSDSDAQTVYPVDSIVWKGKTRFCDSVTIADSPAYGRMLFLDGELQSTTADEHIYHESLVHPAMTQVTSLTQRFLRVLVIGGGEGATVREVLRWDPTHVDWVDIDGELRDLCSQYLPMGGNCNSSEVVKFYPLDIKDFWATPAASVEPYDVIVVDLPDPDIQYEYIYQAQFWRDVVSHLKDHGTFVSHIGPVRPWGSVGSGLPYFVSKMKRADCALRPEGFYHIGIPSFQGDWGYWIWRKDGGDPFDYPNPAGVPDGLRVVDETQLRIWAHPTGMWKSCIQRMLTE